MGADLRFVADGPGVILTGTVRNIWQYQALRAMLMHAPVEWWIGRMPRADFVFLDPPRVGAKSSVIDAIAKKTNRRICFLACDPVTFARDASRLLASGWRLSTLDLLDLFPNTHHVETLSSFERAG